MRSIRDVSEKESKVASVSSPFDQRTSQQRERELTDFVENVAVALHWVAEDGTILWANAAELALLGHSREDYVGRNIKEFHVDEHAIAEILHRLKNKENISNCQARLWCKDGSIRDVCMSSSVYFENDKFVHTRCVTLDNTAQKRSEDLHERLFAIVESSDDAIISKDLNGVIQSWNRGAERIFGYTADEIIGKHISILAAPDRVDEIPNILDRLIRGERVDHYITKRKTKNGRILIISLTVSPIRDSSGRIIGASKVARDITELHQQQAALRAANDALIRSNADLQQFVYSASHDLQEPLRMVSIYGELLQREFGGKLGSVGGEYIGYTVEGALRMERLLRDLRAYTLVSTSAQEPTEALDAADILEKTLVNLTTMIAESGATITMSALPRVRIHKFQLEQLFQNLIANAIRYRSGEPPRIHVDATRRETEWLFCVEDNGIGIAPQYKEDIFGLFKRLHSVSEYPGTGMGLAICQRIVERTGGRIWVESEIGQGSKFFFTIPS